MSGGGIHHLIETAHRHHATLIEASGISAVFSINPPVASGSPTRPFLIVVELRRGVLVAREQTPNALPSSCPERHINSDGTFCLYWPKRDPLRVIDNETASRWWRKLLMFLHRQRTAGALRKWPGSADARAHGPTAAQHQVDAEEAASVLGAAFVAGLRGGQLAVVRRKLASETRVRLLMNGRRIATVVEDPRQGNARVMTLRSRCRCGKGMPLRSCGSHAEALADLAVALDGWRRAEAKFFEEIAAEGQECCGTLDDCPLRSLTQATARAA